jgi:GxxExxY protein
MEIFDLADLVRQTAFEIHAFHGHGHLEKVYENALANRLRKAGIQIQQQAPIQVFDQDGELLGSYAADLLVQDRLIVELKAVRVLTKEHEAQVLAYLKSSRRKHGMLVNFGSYRFEVRKYASPFD